MTIEKLAIKKRKVKTGKDQKKRTVLTIETPSTAEGLIDRVIGEGRVLPGYVPTSALSPGQKQKARLILRAPHKFMIYYTTWKGEQYLKLEADQLGVITEEGELVYDAELDAWHREYLDQIRPR